MGELGKKTAMSAPTQIQVGRIFLGVSYSIEMPAQEQGTVEKKRGKPSLLTSCSPSHPSPRKGLTHRPPRRNSFLLTLWIPTSWFLELL